MVKNRKIYTTSIRISKSNIKHAMTKNIPCNTVPQDVGVVPSTAPEKLLNTLLINTSVDKPIKVKNINRNNLYWILVLASASIVVKSSGAFEYDEIGAESIIVF
jgi:hypothetical protein